MADESVVLESSPGNGNLTAADVDFEVFAETRSKERLAEAQGKQPEPVKVPAVEPQAESAPVKVEAPVSEPADKTKPAATFTSEDATKLIDAKLEALKPKEPKPVTPKTPKEWEAALADPKYQTLTEHLTDVLESGRQQGFEEGRAAATSEITTKQQAEKAAAAWDSRVTEAKARIPDYDELVEIGKTRPFNETALEFIVKSEIGPDLFAHYVRNESEWARLIELPDAAILARLVLVEDRLQQGLSKPEPQVRNVSAALPPPRTLGGKASPAGDTREKAVKEDDFESYQAERARERARDSAGRFA